MKLAQAFEEPLEGLGGQSIRQSYEDLVVRMTQDVNVQAGVSDGLKNFYNTIQGRTWRPQESTWTKKRSGCCFTNAHFKPAVG
ncbi:MAG: hypothetical protein R3C56_25725 [Pirellulaceae bacterium]